ncbi:mannose-1-phosphate guanylyltransferase/mannose-6-phosphate isomerase [Herminiimonas arsenitoxidans]|uniref:mannose-1-phosphate guanylyltransferase/mannose-6-phosphate isomerase n=1 Tax=Herminiimonas arsenitoxidans TaxID=1809410 RepID=UPI000970A9D6|nr:mannose-1-phosphate guanylyltransferase/mannose-6-phosphate isomerase [Herminiimonas arsenitoxidans]
MLLPIILSGGAGSRLWPVSREALPKPFIALPDGETLLQKTLKRAIALPGVEHVLTVTNRDYYFLTRDEYESNASEVDGGHVIHDYLLEPLGRNTAPAIAAAALHAARKHGDDVILLVLPADHLIKDQASFAQAVSGAQELALQGYLVTFGIKPTAPETGYGYIESGEVLSGSPGRKVARFVEKPDLATAMDYLVSGRFTWNSGMFCFTAGAMLAALRECAPDVLVAVEQAFAATALEKDPVVLDAAAFTCAPDISIDYAVMEKAAKVAVIPVSFDWSDIGSWSALAELVVPDARGNRASCETVLIDADNCFIQSDNRMIAAVGVDDLFIVDTPDALLIAHNSRAQDVKSVVTQLKLLSHATVQHHRTTHRPWGTYTVLEEGEGFKLKRIVVKPGASLSLQMHHHRSEHWVVVSGTAKVVNGEQDILVQRNESTYIPAGTAHRLTNPGVVDCVMIEIQTGDYLGEDDIVRLEDRYGRV